LHFEVSDEFQFQFIFQKNALTTIIQVQVTKTKRKPHSELRPTPALKAGPLKACQSWTRLTDQPQKRSRCDASRRKIFQKIIIQIQIYMLVNNIYTCAYTHIYIKTHIHIHTHMQKSNN
jgi:hypothetical protein